MEDQMNGNVAATGNTKKSGFLSSRWAMILATAIIALIIGFALGHCCHRWRHCCGDRCEMGRGDMMMRGGDRCGPECESQSCTQSGHDGMGSCRMHGMMPPMGMRGGFDPAERVEHMKQELGLSDQQVQQITAIFAQQKSKMEAAMKNDSGRGQDWQPNREQLHAQIKAILTPEQQAKWQQQMAGRTGHDQ